MQTPIRDSGWRDITAAIPEAVSGRAVLRRSDSTVVVAFDELILAASEALALPRMPLGLNPRYRYRSSWFLGLTGKAGGSVNISTSGYWNIYDLVSNSGQIGGRFEYDTKDPWPRTFPGTAI